MNQEALRLTVEPLTAAAFEPFGEVIDTASARRSFAINAGTTLRYHALAIAQAEDGEVAISLARAQPQSLPMRLRLLERHPLGTQAFVPAREARWLVVVSENPDARPRVFLAVGGQGVQYRRGCWHHPLIALDALSDFLIVDRIGAGDNCEEAALARAWWVGPVALAGAAFTT